MWRRNRKQAPREAKGERGDERASERERGRTSIVVVAAGTHCVTGTHSIVVVREITTLPDRAAACSTPAPRVSGLTRREYASKRVGGRTGAAGETSKRHLGHVVLWPNHRSADKTYDKKWNLP